MTNGDDKAFQDKTIFTTIVDGKTESAVMPDGLTKREYFAAMAMQGIIGTVSADDYAHGIAEDAVDLADELIKALNK